MAKTKTYQTPDGVLTLELLEFETLRASIVYNRVIEGAADIETLKALDVDEWRHLSSFATCLGHTKSIAFNLPQKPSKALLAFQKFWEKNAIPANRDYATLYEEFVDNSDKDLYTAWVTAFNSTREEALVAPPELRVGSAIEAQTNDFLEQGESLPLTELHSS